MITIAYLKKFWDLSLCLANVGFKIRNEGSYLGILWYLLNPIFLFILLLIIFSRNLGVEIEHYPLYLLLGIILYNLFQATTTEATILIRESRDLVKSINFPRATLITGGVLKMLFSHLFEIVIFVILMIILGTGNLFNILFYLIILISFAFFILGVSLFLGAISVYFIDIKNIWAFLLRLLLFGTPIFYTPEEGSKLTMVNSINPLYYFIDISRLVLVYNKVPPWEEMAIAISFSLLSFCVGFLVFNKLKNRFAEVV